MGIKGKKWDLSLLYLGICAITSAVISAKRQDAAVEKYVNERLNKLEVKESTEITD